MKKYSCLVHFVKIMGISLLSVRLWMIVLGTLLAHVTFSQQLLTKKITLHCPNQPLKSILFQIESQADVNFMFSPAVIQSQRITSLDVQDQPLSQVLEQLLKPLNIKYRIADRRIILTANKQESPEAIPLKKNITGHITDESGSDLPGVNVRLKGTHTGTATDSHGRYNLDFEDENPVIIFSYVGYISKEIAVGKEFMIDVVLQVDSKGLDEIVVMGYGQQRKSEISGSVSGITVKAIMQNPSPTLSNTLIGQTAGIIATQRSGEPGNDASNIYIRGIGTTGDASPIYVIDGIIRPASDFAQLNVNEIQSFSILKDAASAAVFGVRAGNGVILVNTKRGVAGKTQFSYSANFGFQRRTRTPQYLNAYELGTLYNEAMANQGRPSFYSESDLAKYQNHSEPDRYPDSDWTSILRTSAPISQHNLSVSGGTEKVRHASSVSYLIQDGIIPSTNFKRYNFRSNLDADLTRTTLFAIDLAGRNELTHNLPTPIAQIFQRIGATPPNRYPVRYSNGLYPNGPSYLLLKENGYDKKSLFAFRGRIQLTQQLPFVEGLSVRAIGYFDKTLTDTKLWVHPVTPFYSLLPDGTYQNEPLGANSLNQDHYDDQSAGLEMHLNYEHSMNNGKISALLLYTQTHQKWSDLNGYREGYINGVDELNFGAAANRNNGGYSGSSGRRGVVGRVNYSLNEKLSLETSFRADGSEQFAVGKRWGIFPSVSAGWIISQESFLQTSKIIEHLKLRGSYGILGNDRIGGARFLYLKSYYGSGNAVFGDGDVQQAISENNLPNPDVTWETVKKLDLGIDAAFFDGKLTTVFDYFYDKRTDILGYRNAAVPGLLGILPPVENFARVDNRGVEITLSYCGKLGNSLRYSTGANLTYVRNKVVFIDEPGSTNPNIKRTGNPLNTEFGFHALGIFQTQAEVDAAAVQVGPTAPGDIRYEDVNRDGIINDLDRVKIGKANTPEIILGYNGRINYMNFEFSFLFQGASKVNQWYRAEAAWPFFIGAGAVKQNLDRWTPSNPGASEPRVLGRVTNMNHYDDSSFWLRDASYLRLKSAELAYSLPRSVLSGTFIGGLRLFINANNIFTWSKIKNFDPENGNDRGWGYPHLRTSNVGLTLQF